MPQSNPVDCSDHYVHIEVRCYAETTICGYQGEQGGSENLQFWILAGEEKVYIYIGYTFEIY